jgi:CheY-like chemotaxis protein
MRMSASVRQAEVLLVDDNAGDARLTAEALKEGVLDVRLSVARNGLDALAFLRREGAYATAPRPDLVLLDLNLPTKDGREVLRELKADPALRRIPVVVLSTSDAPQDIADAYDLHANCYITKPVEMTRFIEVMRLIEQFWLTVVQLPGGHGGA